MLTWIKILDLAFPQNSLSPLSSKFWQNLVAITSKILSCNFHKRYQIYCEKGKKINPTSFLKKGAVEQTMKQEGEVLVVACRPMAGISPVSVNSLTQRPFPTPSPFTFSVASTRWSSRPSIHYSNLVLRFLALIFSFVSALSLAASSPKKKGQLPSSFTGYSELM